MNKRNEDKKSKLSFEDDEFLFSDSPRINRKKSKNEYIVFYAAGAVASIVVLIILSMIFLNQFGIGNNGTQTAENPPTYNNTNENEIVENPLEDTENILGMIAGIDYQNRMLFIHNLYTRVSSNLVIQNTSNLRGRLGNALIFEELNLGDIVEIDHLRANVVNLTISGNAWERRAVSGIEILENNQLRLGNEIFEFNTDTLVLNQNSEYSIHNINALSQVTMQGVGETVWFIEITRGFGTAQVINASSVINGSLHIDSVTIPLGSEISPLDQVIYLSEGTHRAVIHGENIIRTTRDINVITNELTIIDLADLQLTQGHLLVNLNVPQATVSINGVARDISNPILLNFGQHTVNVVASGFENYERVFMMENNNQTLHVTLEAQQITEVPENTNNEQNNNIASNQNNNQGGGFGTNNNANTQQPQTGRVDIRSLPAGASLFVDDVLVGTTPFTGTLEVGTRSIRVQLEGFINTQAALNVTTGINNPVEYELQPLPTIPQPGFPMPDPIMPPEEEQTDNNQFNNILDPISPPPGLSTDPPFSDLDITSLPPIPLFDD
ncbi:MAG: PEGA domain-containing protein [Defluviitaleaceae bacterium]|nr:PEGA domain-containing protein [Defluviitaleaceae bacterium]